MDKEPSHLLTQAGVVRGRLPLRGTEIYHHVSQQEEGVHGYLPHAVIKGERENISGYVPAAVDAVEVFHPPVIHEEYAEFSLVKAERCEKFQGVLF